ncbi:hypothetical protein MOQ72_30980 [Saccharopolyspora sp. K220]|uniref:hypothetical protein n=1 Tax=Saccharopolyspora soli TaxID=2926618 RepID=UPI001F57C7E7|nr:hypothetical protein [Saccharopolyspora soli]MCI2421869.1 hypothetical protein [Saccharopolyspora soli]
MDADRLVPHLSFPWHYRPFLDRCPERTAIARAEPGGSSCTAARATLDAEEYLRSGGCTDGDLTALRTGCSYC